MPQKPSAHVRNELLRDYVQHYTALAQEDLSLLNQKIPKNVFATILAQVGKILLQEASVMVTKDGPVREFLDQNALPPSLVPYLPDDFRAFCLLMNALKQWVSAEQAATDRYFLAGRVRAELRTVATHCIVTGAPLCDGEIELHHPVRDGRPPLPLSKVGHAMIENQTKNPDGEV